jgi:hypothetical protein
VLPYAHGSSKSTPAVCFCGTWTVNGWKQLRSPPTVLSALDIFSVALRRFSTDRSGLATCTREAPAAKTAKSLSVSSSPASQRRCRQNAVVCGVTLCGGRGLGAREDLGHRTATQCRTRVAFGRDLIGCTRTDVA